MDCMDYNPLQKQRETDKKLYKFTKHNLEKYNKLQKQQITHNKQEHLISQ